MFTSLCKFFHLLQQRPGWLFSAACLATLLSLIPLQHFRVRAAGSDLLPSDWQSVQAWKSFGRKFGSAGHLAVVVHSPNPRRNLALVESLARRFQSRHDVNFLEYRTEADFYREHKLLYISLSDLREIENRVQTGFWINRTKNNPLIFDLLSEDEKDSAFGSTSFDDLEAKYFSRLKDLIGSPDSTVLVLRIYPAFDVTDIHACRDFLSEVQLAVANISQGSEGAEGNGIKDTTSLAGKDSLEVLYTGDVVHNIQNEGRLFSRVLATTRIALILSAVLLLINFVRFPVGALLSMVPVSMAILWTLALTRLWLGPLGLVTTPLGLLLVGLGLCGTVHLLARYAEERRKRLSAPVAFETITLETGPAIAAGLCTLAVAFLAFLATDFKALSDFGLMAGIGMVCTLFAVLAVFPSLLRLVEPWGWLNPAGVRLYNLRQEHVRPFRFARPFLGIALVLSALFMLRGPQWRFQYDFNSLGFGGDETRRADSLLQAAGENLGTPAVFLTPNDSTAQAVADELRLRAASDTGSAIGEVATLRDLLPADQEEKLRITSRLRSSITPKVLKKAREPLRSSLLELTRNWPTRPLTVRDLPRNYRLKFEGRSVTPGVFTYVFPRSDSSEGLNSLKFAGEVRSVTVNGRTYYAGGWPVLYGDLVGHMIPDVRRALVLGLLAIFLVLLLTVRSFTGALVLLLPVLATLIWMLGTLKWMHIKINPYNLVAFPVAMAYATIHALHLHHRYEEEGRGSLPLVLRRTGRTAVVTTLIGAAGFVPMIFSGHRGLASLGIAAVLGLGFSLVSSVLIVSGVLGVWEGKRLKKEREEGMR